MAARAPSWCSVRTWLRPHRPVPTTHTRLAMLYNPGFSRAAAHKALSANKSPDDNSAGETCQLGHARKRDARRGLILHISSRTAGRCCERNQQWPCLKRGNPKRVSRPPRPLWCRFRRRGDLEHAICPRRLPDAQRRMGLADRAQLSPTKSVRSRIHRRRSIATGRNRVFHRTEGSRHSSCRITTG